MNAYVAIYMLIFVRVYNFVLILCIYLKVCMCVCM